MAKGGYLNVHTRSSRKDGSVSFLFGFSNPVYTADVKRQRLPAVQLAPTNLFLAWGATIIGWFCVSCLTFHTSICSLASSHLSGHLFMACVVGFTGQQVSVLSITFAGKKNG